MSGEDCGWCRMDRALGISATCTLCLVEAPQPARRVFPSRPPALHRDHDDDVTAFDRKAKSEGEKR